MRIFLIFSTVTSLIPFNWFTNNCFGFYIFYVFTRDNKRLSSARQSCYCMKINWNMFESNTDAIRSPNLKKDRQYNDQ